MRQRGRKSAEALQAVSIEPRIGRPPAPESLADDQRQCWRDIVDSMPPDWFSRETLPILEALVCHISRHRKLCQALDSAPDDAMLDVDQFKHWQALAKAADVESRGIVSCSRSLRLTHQSQYDAAKAARRAGAVAHHFPKPLEQQG